MTGRRCNKYEYSNHYTKNAVNSGCAGVKNRKKKSVGLCVRTVESKSSEDGRIKKHLKKAEKQEVDNRIQNITEEFETVFNSGIPTKKMAVDYTYDLLRRSMKAESSMKNYLLSAMFSEVVLNGKSEKEAKKSVKELWNSGIRAKGSPKGSLYDGTPIETPLAGYGFGFNQQLSSRFWDAMKSGLAYGNVSLPSYKSDSPLTIAKAHLHLAHEYDNAEEFCEHRNDSDVNVSLVLGPSASADTIARFSIVLGKPHKSKELRMTIARIFTGEYSHCGSSIQFDKDGKKIMLNLSMTIPVQEVFLDENIIVGVNRGIAVPVVCALNTSSYIRESIGSKDDFFRVRNQMNARRTRLSKSLRNTSNGHGRKKRMQAEKRFQGKERNFAKSYNHMLSRRIVDFAVKNHAKYIYLEDLEGYESDDTILRYWSYYELEQFIIYKAAFYGIIVKKVNAGYISQVCVECGVWNEDNRESRADFVCKNPECKKHGKRVSAEFNAARNVSLSTLLVKPKPKNIKLDAWKKKQLEQAREYYNISKEDLLMAQ
jgi:IS605 OrfB family transposase